MFKILLILASLMSFSYAQEVNEQEASYIRCTSSQDIVITTNFSRELFRMPEFELYNVTADGLSTTITVREQFGANFAFINRVWAQPQTTCRQGYICLSDDFSGMQGLTFEIPSALLGDDRVFTNVRLRDNRNFRSYFLTCNN